MHPQSEWVQFSLAEDHLPVRGQRKGWGSNLLSLATFVAVLKLVLVNAPNEYLPTSIIFHGWDRCFAPD